MEIVVLRIGHRPERDHRITTHIGLTARALGADGMLLASKDNSIKQSIDDVVKRWGGDFYVQTNINWKKEINKWKNSEGVVCHLTMYGLNLPDVIDSIKKSNKIMIVVGAEKVPSELYQIADWNVAIGNQPHSEVAALALMLDRLHNGMELKKKFYGELEIIPSKRSKVFK